MYLNILMVWFPHRVGMNKFHLRGSLNYWRLNSLECVYQYNTDKVMHDSLAEGDVLTKADVRPGQPITALKCRLCTNVSRASFHWRILIAIISSIPSKERCNPHEAVSVIRFRYDKMLRQKQKLDPRDQSVVTLEVDIIKTRQQQQRSKSWFSLALKVRKCVL